MGGWVVASSSGLSMGAAAAARRLTDMRLAREARSVLRLLAGARWGVPRRGVPNSVSEPPPPPSDSELYRSEALEWRSEACAGRGGGG